MPDGDADMQDQQNQTPASGQSSERVPLRITRITGKDLIKIEFGASEPMIITSDAAFEVGKALIEGAYAIQRDKFVKLIPNKNRNN